MKLFKIVDWNIQVAEEAWTIVQFNAILKRDKSKSKEKAFKEMAFIYHYADARSDYMYITDLEDRRDEVMKDVGLPLAWSIDPVMGAAIDVYKERSSTVSEILYLSALKSARDIADYLNGTKSLLKERDDKGKPVNTIASITGALKGIPDIMSNLSESYKALIKEKEDLEGKKKGAKKFGMFENGLQ